MSKEENFIEDLKSNLNLLPDFYLGYLLKAYLKLYKGSEYVIPVGLSETKTYTVNLTDKYHDALSSFIKNYNSLYLKKELQGQNWEYSPVYELNNLLKRFNESRYIERYGYHNLTITKNRRYPNLFHRLMSLSFQEKIKIKEIYIGNGTFYVVFDNLVNTQKDSTHNINKLEWSDNFQWQGNTFFFDKYGSISFKEGDSKELFRLLATAQGEWVTTKKLREVNINAPTLIGQIRERVKIATSNKLTIESTTAVESSLRPDQGGYRINKV